MEEEVWKEIDGYDEMYLISNLGNVYSRYTKKILKHSTTQDGYPYVMLRKDGRQKCNLIHRLVAIAFIPNPDNLPIINHKDEDKMNYSIGNLEWCDYSYNNTYNGIHNIAIEKISNETYAYDRHGNLVYQYKSANEAARDLDYSNGCISACCKGDILTYKNLVWSYIKLSKEDVVNKFQESYLKRKDRKNNSLSRPVNKFDLNGKFICQYPSTQEVGRQLKFSPSLVAGVCRGEHKHTHGYIFRYADDMNCEENKNMNLSIDS